MMVLPPLVPVEKLCRPFSLAEIISATHNFDDSLVIGKGGFGKVYKGVIDNETTIVAIKRLNSTSKQGESQFRTEIEMLSRFRHSHIVSLIGYCYTSSEMILVYEYMSNGSLADHLYRTNKNSRGCTLSWVQRLKICLGAARGLDYLHTGTSVEESVIHRDVKSSNILLDSNWVAKISDFGLSKTNPVNKSYTRTNPKGTVGYMDPEYMLTLKLRMKSDVYSFGVVLFEVLCGRRARDLTLDEKQRSLAEWASQCFEEGIVHRITDPNLEWEILPDSLAKFMEIAYQCLCYHSKKRPTMTQVVASIESALALQIYNTDYSALEIDIFGNLEDVHSTIVQEEAIKIHNSVKPTKKRAFRKMLQLLSLCVDWEALGRKLARGKRTSQQFDAHQDSNLNKEEMVTNIDNKFEKVDIIFRHFDTDRDNCLNLEEIRALFVATNPSVKYARLNAVLVTLFETYSEFTDGEKGITFLGFLQMYDDGVGDVDRDFATIGFEL